jgi:hypothetical protein
VRARAPRIAAAYALGFATLTTQTTDVGSAQDGVRLKRITWTDTAPLHTQLEAHGITAGTFPAYAQRVRRAHARRVREGDLDHLVFYTLQSTRLTDLPPIEPALSAKALVESLPDSEREAFLRTSHAAPSRIPPSVRSRISALIRALAAPSGDPRVTYFRELVNASFPDRRQREGALLREYLRVMRFVYEKEFVAQRSPDSAAAVAELYRARGLSTDTAVEAGYVIALGLGVLKALEPDRRIRRVLIIGPGLDLAPRTSLLEAGPPASYQPWAVIDALLSLGLSRADDLTVVGADINPRVVAHLRRVRVDPPALNLVSEIRVSDTVALTDEYRDYFARLGREIGEVDAGAPSIDGAKGHLQKTVRVSRTAAHVLRAELLDVVIERIDGPPFDLIIATNVLPYFDDVELTLAMANVAGMLAPGGVFLHNEARPLMQDVTAAVGLPFEQSRHAIIAAVRGAAAPLFDSVWLHRKIRVASGFQAEIFRCPASRACTPNK